MIKALLPEGMPMNMRDDISMKTDDVLKVELEVFRREHSDLDEAIRALQDRGTSDQLTLQRLKKQKLLLKDRIALIEDRLTPDIIACPSPPHPHLRRTPPA